MNKKEAKILYNRIISLRRENNNLRRKLRYVAEKLDRTEMTLLKYEPFGTINTEVGFPLEDFPTDLKELYKELDEHFRNGE